ncbi:MAG: prepilin-type N-terminal cleavage/methylation domain-containing protein [Planctomycetota bacterium]
MTNLPRPAVPQCRRSRAGFTLIELLVVISIIALLIGILLPALGAARNLGRNAVCLANLKGITTASHAYAADQDGFFPCNGQWGQRGWSQDQPGQTGFASATYRAGAGFTVADNPFEIHAGTGPEDVGLGAALEHGGYMVGGGDPWICPSRTRELKDNGNTYAFNASKGPERLFGTTIQSISDRDKRFDVGYTRADQIALFAAGDVAGSGQSRVPWVFDSTRLGAAPAGTPLIGTVSPLRGEPNEAKPHDIDADGPGINDGYFDGSAGTRSLID